MILEDSLGLGSLGFKERSVVIAYQWASKADKMLQADAIIIEKNKMYLEIFQGIRISKLIKRN